MVDGQAWRGLALQSSARILVVDCYTRTRGIEDGAGRLSRGGDVVGDLVGWRQDLEDQRPPF